MGTQIHTAPEAFGKVMSHVKPRMAVAYHFFKDWDTTGDVFARIRSTYDGPLSLAEDFMVWNITKDDIRTRMSVVDHEIWPSPPIRDKIPPDTAAVVPFSEFTISGALAFPEIIKPIYDEVNEMYGTKVEPLFK